MKVNAALVARLLYLLSKNDDIKIPKALLRFIPGSQFIVAVINDGIGGSDVDPNILEALLKEGSKDFPGPGNSVEVVNIIQRLVDDNLRSDTKLNIQDRLKVYRILDGLKAVMAEETMEIDLSNPGEIEGIPKFDTGFQPLDAVTGGFYQGIFLLMGPPGTGKTTISISLAETLRQNHHPGSIWVIQNEIPGAMMRGRMSPIFKRTKFLEGDKLICGPWSANHILNYMKDYPDKERVIIFDGPDVMGRSENSFGKKQFIENEYLTMIEMKALCKAVIATGWPNRKNPTVTHYNDVGDAIEKARYADAIIGMNKHANGRLQLKSLKNRFGPPDLELTFEFDQETIQWKAGTIETEEDFWGALMEEQNQDAETAAQQNGSA